ncbi:MAG: HEAT repeat domain-containing protein [Candidatus Sericytochromatia bacterium]
MHLPYKEIIEKQDRSFTGNLLNLLISENISDEEFNNVIKALNTLEDPRSWNTLKEIALNKNNSNKIRESAIQILSNSLYSMEREEVLFLWGSNDLLTKKLALHFMDKNDEELILNIIDDKDHKLNKEAMEVFFNSFQFREGNHELAFKLINHEDPDIRELAVNFFYWEETAEGLPFLIKASYDSNINVVIKACEALEYYPSIESLKRLAILKSSNNQDISETADQSYEVIREQFLSYLKDKNIIISNHIKNWLKPVWELISYSEEELYENEEFNKTEKKKNILPEIDKETIYKYLSVPDTSPLKINNLFFQHDWDSIPEKERKDIIELILNHPDPDTRSNFCSKLAKWNDQESLIKLVYDKDILVQKSAMYYLGETTPVSDKIATLAWERLQKKNVTGFYERETLGTYVIHSLNKNEVFENLFKIANNPENSEDIRYVTIEKLIEFKCVDKLKTLMWVIKEKPRNSWALHNFLLEASEKFNIEIDISHLIGVDDLYIQKNIAPLIKKHKNDN